MHMRVFEVLKVSHQLSGDGARCSTGDVVKTREERGSRFFFLICTVENWPLDPSNERYVFFLVTLCVRHPPV